MTITHSRLSFGQLVRRAKRADMLVHYSANADRRLALLKGGEWHTFSGRGARCTEPERDEAYERAAARGRLTDFDGTGRDWT